MKKLFTVFLLIGIVLTTNIFAQEVYWTEDWNDDTIEGRLTGTSSEAATSYTEVNQTSGTWKAIYAYRGGSNMCDGGGRTLRLLKEDPASRPQGGGVITPSLESGVGTITFVEGRGGTNRIIEVAKSQNEGLTWEVVTTVNGTEKCKDIVITVNDPLANRIRFVCKGTGDCDLDNIKITKSTNVGVEEEYLPTEFSLKQNFPNPFNPTTTIAFDLAVPGNYSISVYNLLGQEVANLFNKEMSAGSHFVTFDASKLSSGMYFYKLTGNNVNIIKKMVLMK